MTPPTGWDVVVVGAGPAGAAAAYGLARSGATVLLLDRARFPRSKVCGACLSPGALASLGEIGLSRAVREAGAVPLSRLVLCAGGRSAGIALEGSASLSRARLDELIVRAAVGAGANFQDGVTARLALDGGRPRVLVRDGGEERIVSVAAVVDATGLGRGLGDSVGERVAPSAPRSGALGSNAPSPRPRHGRTGPTAGKPRAGSRLGLGAALDDATYPLTAGELRMAIGASGYVGLVRLEDGRLNVGAAVDPAALRSARPGQAVASVLREAGVAVPEVLAESDWRGTPSLTRIVPPTSGPRIVRVGDASGYVEPFTGEGICWALDGGLMAADLVARALSDRSFDLAAAWSAHRREATARGQRLCRLLARGLRHPRLARAVVGLLPLAPALAAPFVHRAGRRPSTLVRWAA